MYLYAGHEDEHEHCFLAPLSCLSPTQPPSRSDPFCSVQARLVRPAFLPGTPTTHPSFPAAPNEKGMHSAPLIIHVLTLLQVLLYLEGLRESQTIGSPNSSGFPNIALPSSKLSALDNDHDFDDINSNVQDGRKTELSIGGRSAVVVIPLSFFPSRMFNAYP